MRPDIESRDIGDLQPDFRKLMSQLLDNCGKRRSVTLKPFFTVRGPLVQARLWCQSRTPDQVRQAVQELNSGGAPWLASLLDPALAQKGRWATDALPGASWHQWAQAADCFVVGPQGQALWGTPQEPPALRQAALAGYKAYAEQARALGLNAGFFWKKAKDAVHVQLARAPCPPGSWREIEARMRELYSSP